LFAFENANQGDLFVQKADASTVGDLATAMKHLFDSDVDVNVIGTRHGEKAHETLLTREERAKSEDLGGYFRVPADTRDLNYEKFVESGDVVSESLEEYTSHNTHQLTVDQIIEKIKTTDYLKSLLPSVTSAS
jgi:UDP-glucose 4-epimerase